MKHKSNPSVRKVEIRCEGCNTKGTIFFTNKEIWNNTTIQQQCSVCDRFTKWGLNT